MTQQNIQAITIHYNLQQQIVILYANNYDYAHTQIWLNDTAHKYCKNEYQCIRE